MHNLINLEFGLRGGWMFVSSFYFVFVLFCFWVFFHVVSFKGDVFCLLI